MYKCSGELGLNEDPVPDKLRRISCDGRGDAKTDLIASRMTNREEVVDFTATRRACLASHCHCSPGFLHRPPNFGAKGTILGTRKLPMVLQTADCQKSCTMPQYTSDTTLEEVVLQSIYGVDYEQVASEQASKSFPVSTSNWPTFTHSVGRSASI